MAIMAKFKRRRYEEISRVVAMSSYGVGGSSGRNFRLGSVLVCRNGTVFSAVNSYKTHTILAKHYTYPYFHAEAACILKAGTCNCEKGVLYISRVKRNGSLGLAYPCKECMALIRLAKIKHVYYSTENGYEQAF